MSQGRVEDYYTYAPFKDDLVAAKAHERLVAKRPMIEWIEASGSNPRIVVKTKFSSEALQSRLAEVKWPKTTSWGSVPDYAATKARFDLADAYTYCFLAHESLAHPDWGETRYAVRPWPVDKIKRQFQRALTVAGDLSQEERERLYFALVKSAARAQDWWYEIEIAINARGDVMGNCYEAASFVMKWLVGLRIGDVETQYLSAGIRRKLEPRPKVRKPPP